MDGLEGRAEPPAREELREEGLDKGRVESDGDESEFVRDIHKAAEWFRRRASKKNVGS
jgi:hypothetical protein